MAKKTFALEMNGVEVKTLEELRENFNLEEAVEYFKSGELVDWLADRFYDDEADAIENISADDKNLSQKICAALDVECDEDLEFTQRVREKKKILAEKTDDENIIDNATTTALNQDDLANLLHMDYPTIFLCGENFTVPIRVENKKYIGVLSTPKIKIKANSQEDLDTKNISFENCKLPFMKVVPIEELQIVTEKIFEYTDWEIIDENSEYAGTFHQTNLTEQKMAINLCCGGKYLENQIIFMKFRDDFSSGFAFTTDSFCTGGIIGQNVIKYKNIKNVTYETYYKITILTSEGNYHYDGWHNEDVKILFGDDEEFYKKIVRFLNVVKNF